MLQICLLPPPPFLSQLSTIQAATRPPQEFLDFLHNLVAQNLDGDPAARIPAANKELWTTVVTGLSEQFLASFPSTDKVQWHVMHEKVRLAAASLDVIRRVSNRVDDIFHGPGDLALRTFARLLNFCNVVEMWLDVEFEQMDGLPTPRELADDALQTTLLVLRSLGGAVVHVAESKVPLWKTLRVILAECLDVVTGKCDDRAGCHKLTQNQISCPDPLL
ncbi:hypothetical protein B0H13DRAFT_1650064 [Mycena leptocephala]|nr:hypothetical protein B0H13DRAFT_1656018 [Mycena leptocephala]KAJ7839748.1 hypothetical protein B0H13DRAFT_1650064 [Mycena leptocephala]